jgi:2'-hydroxyisoflavone reductase
LKLLVLGGTKFVGRALVERALAGEHAVTLFHRGQTNDDLFPGAEHVHADRDGGLDALGDRQFDACIDVSGYVPRVVRQSAELLRDRVARYIFVSTVSVYSDLSKPSDEGGQLATLDDESVEDITAESYGGLKVLCERVVSEVYGDRSVVARPTFVVGTNDHTGRFTWWVHRAALGGEVLVPESSAWRIQLIDARDLARFLLLAASDSSLSGPYNVVGPAVEAGLVDVVEDTASLAGTEVRPVVVADEVLVEHGVTTEELPIWIPEQGWSAWAHTSGERAVAAGLVHTPLVETIRAILDGAKPADGVGLTPDRERELLAAWHGR